MFRTACAFILLWNGVLFSQEIDTVWLTFSHETPDTVTVCWLTDKAGDSTVCFGGKTRTQTDSDTLHQVEIPMPPENGSFIYHVETRTENGALRSRPRTLNGFPTEELRIVFLGNLHCKKLPPAVAEAKPNLLVSCGDNIPSLHTKGLPKEQASQNIQPFARLVKNNADLFAETIFMTVPGNHDREIAPRGPRVAGASQFYDTTAAAFCRFFPLPDKRWCWTLAVPRFSLRIVGLDLNHTSDFGTSLETCHSWKKEDAQFAWYQGVMENAKEKILVTVQNEKSSIVRGLDGGAWSWLLQKNDFFIAGFGNYAERKVLDGTTYFNTSTYGRGDKYPEPENAFFAGIDNFLLLTVKEGKTSAQLRNLDDGTPLEEM